MINNISSNNVELNLINSFVNQGIDILIDEKNNIKDFGLLLKETWKIKKSLSKKISNTKKITNTQNDSDWEEIENQ